MSQFFVKDLSGRGYTVTRTAKEMKEWPDLSEETIEFIDCAEVGDEHFDDEEAIKIVRIK